MLCNVEYAKNTLNSAKVIANKIYNDYFEPCEPDVVTFQCEYETIKTFVDIATKYICKAGECLQNAVDNLTNESGEE